MAWLPAADDAGNRLCPACRCPEPDPAVFAAAVARWRPLGRLREFRSRLHGCLARRAGALFERAGAVLCADHAVASLVQPSLGIEHAFKLLKGTPGRTAAKARSPR